MTDRRHSICHLSGVYSEALEPLAIRQRVLILDLTVRHNPSLGAAETESMGAPRVVPFSKNDSLHERRAELEMQGGRGG